MDRWIQARRFGPYGGSRGRIGFGSKRIRPSGKGRASDWTVVGPDKSGDDLEVALILEDGVLVITIY